MIEHSNFPSETMRLLKALRSFLLGKPILAVWNLTNNCNFHCLFCNSKIKNSGEQSLPALEKTCQKLRQLGIQYVYLQGGEPLLRSDITEILKMALRNGMKPVLITNGSLLNHDLINFIKGRDVNLSVSLHALDPEIHEALTGDNSSGKIVSFLESLRNIKHRGNWSITTTVCKLNYREVEKIEQFAQRNNFMFAMRCYVNNCAVQGINDQKISYNGIKDEIISILKKFTDRELKRNYFTHLLYREEVGYLRGDWRNGCDAGKYSILVNSDGSISPCIEKPKLSILATARETAKFLKLKRVREAVATCSNNSPCFYGCGRNIGILLQHKMRLVCRFYKPEVLRYHPFF